MDVKGVRRGGPHIRHIIACKLVIPGLGACIQRFDNGTGYGYNPITKITGGNIVAEANFTTYYDFR